MKKFSERFGFVEQKLYQVNTMDGDTKVSLWNALHLYFWQFTEEGNAGDVANENLDTVTRIAWVNLFKWDLSELTWDWNSREKRISEEFYNVSWWRVCEIIEYFAPQADVMRLDGTTNFVKFCNDIFERERFSYKFVSGSLVQLTNETEIDEVEAASTISYEIIGEHIKSAIRLLAIKPDPDFRNSIKESISAVEAACKLIDGRENATLPRALARLRNKVDLHADFEQGFKKIYDYTSDANGIRHSLLEKSNLDSDDARFMLVSCSAFVNYLLRLAEKSGVISNNA